MVPCRSCVATDALDAYAAEDTYAVAKARAMVKEPPPYSTRYSQPDVRDKSDIRDKIAVAIRAKADQYEKDGQPGILGYNQWGWRTIASVLREVADEIVASSRVPDSSSKPVVRPQETL